MKHTLPAAIFAMCLSSLCATARDLPHSKLAPSDWASIRAAHEAASHSFSKQGDGTYRATNRSQRWLMQFDTHGFTATPKDAAWTWGLELKGLVTNDVAWRLSDGSAMAKANRLSISRGDVEEWFVNDARGLEQGWTIHEVPHGSAALQLDLSVRGELKAESADTNIVRFVQQSGETALTYGGLKAWDATGRTLPSTLVATDAATLRIEVNTTGAQFPVTIDPIAQQAYVKPAAVGTIQGGDSFGSMIAVSGDTVVVGAWQEDSGTTGINSTPNEAATNSGAAYVFVRNGSTWTQQAYLKASNTGANDYFGKEVAISGDTIVVGAQAESSNATGVNASVSGGSGTQADNSLNAAGAAYVFVRSGSTWTQQAYLKASNTGTFDLFGASVTVSGDTIVVGASGESSNATGVNAPLTGGSSTQADNSASSAGAAYVFTRSGVTWTQQAYLKASNAGVRDGFGFSVSLSGDTLVVGAGGEESNATGVNAPLTGGSGTQSDNSLNHAGAAYVFERSGATWTQQAYLKASNTGANDNFGYRVSASGDTVVVSAPDEDSNATGINAPKTGGSGTQADNSASGSGAVYVYVRSGLEWTQQAYLKASNAGASDGFGQGLALSGDLIAVGAPGESSNASGVNAALTGGSGTQSDNSVSNSGAAYSYLRSGTSWAQQAYLKASTVGSGDGFGISVALAGDLVAVGASGEDSNATGINAPITGGTGTQADNSQSSAGAAFLFIGVGVTPPVPLTSLSKSNISAPGALDIAFSSLGTAAINAQGEVLFDQGLTGSGSSAGRNRAVFSTLASTSVLDLGLQSGTSLAGVAGYGSNAKASNLALPIANRDDAGLFSVTVTGTGVTAANNTLIMKDDGVALTAVRRTGIGVAELGNALPSKFYEVLQGHDQDLISIPVSLSLSTPLGVNANNDTALLLLNHSGSLTNATPPREGATTGTLYGSEAGTLGQFTGKAAGGIGSTVHFGAMFKPSTPTNAKPVAALFFTAKDGTTTGRTAKVGEIAPGAGGTATFATLPAFTQQNGQALFRATLKGATATTDEGLWRGTTLLTRESDAVDTVSLPGVQISSIKKFWPVGNDQVILQVLLKGTSVTTANSTALLLRQSDGAYLVLLRCGLAAPGLSPATLTTISTVEVDPITGHYAVVAVLGKATTSTNQALFAGQTTLGDDSTNRALRLPTMRLQKGSRYTSEQTPLGTVKSITLKPAVDATGAGARGLAQAVANGKVALYVLTDRSLTELVLLDL